MSWPVLPYGFLETKAGNPETDLYQVSRSLRFNATDKYLSRTFTTPTNNKIFTYSTWLKVSLPSAARNPIFVATNAGATSMFALEFATSRTLSLFDSNFSTSVAALITSQVFRDTAAWYHIIMAVDTTQATAADRVKLYVNGSEITAFSSANYPALNSSPYMNSAVAHNIGSWTSAVALFYDGYMAEINFIDGLALTPSSFGETESVTGRWRPIAYAGAYGANGFYLNFSDNSGISDITLGKDSAVVSGTHTTANNFTPNSFSVTTGIGNDSLVDSPTSHGSDSYTTNIDNVRGNYNTFSQTSEVSTAVLARGNLNAGASGIAIGTIGMTSGSKWYWEVTSTGGATAVGMYGTAATATRSVASGLTEGFTFDGVGTLAYTTNGSTFTNIATGLTAMPYFTYVSTAASTTASLNCGQRTFAYTMPATFKTLCATNLPTPIIQKPQTYMDVVTYTGTGSAITNSSLSFSPDLVWLKSRSAATDHALYDSVRLATKDLASNLNTGETTQVQGLTAFTTSGFTIGTLAKLNTLSATYVGWAWGEAVTSGLDIVSYTGSGASRVISHNLGVTPEMLIVKNRSVSTTGWATWHSGILGTEYLKLDATAGTTTAGGFWNSTTPTASSFSVGSNTTTNSNTDLFIAYVFAGVSGFSRFGTYTGSGTATGPFVWCGFRPAFILVKSSSASSSWLIYDSKRLGYNIVSSSLKPDLPDLEASISGIDFLSNGFKLRTIITNPNAATTYIFAAFAEAPFKYARAR